MEQNHLILYVVIGIIGFSGYMLLSTKDTAKASAYDKLNELLNRPDLKGNNESFFNNIIGGMLVGFIGLYIIWILSKKITVDQSCDEGKIWGGKHCGCLPELCRKTDTGLLTCHDLYRRVGQDPAESYKTAKVYNPLYNNGYKVKIRHPTECDKCIAKTNQVICPEEEYLFSYSLRSDQEDVAAYDVYDASLDIIDKSEFVQFATEDGKCLEWTGLDEAIGGNVGEAERSCRSCLDREDEDINLCEADCLYLSKPAESERKTISLNTCFERRSWDNDSTETKLVNGGKPKQTSIDYVDRESSPPREYKNSWARERQFWRLEQTSDFEFKICSYVHVEYCLAINALSPSKPLEIHNENYLQLNEDKYIYNFLIEKLPLQNDYESVYQCKGSDQYYSRETGKCETPPTQCEITLDEDACQAIKKTFRNDQCLC